MELAGRQLILISSQFNFSIAYLYYLNSLLGKILNEPDERK